MEEANSVFDLYREAKDAYHRLIPEKEDGLILLSLYERFGCKMAGTKKDAYVDILGTQDGYCIQTLRYQDGRWHIERKAIL